MKPRVDVCGKRDLRIVAVDPVSLEGLAVYKGIRSAARLEGVSPEAIRDAIERSSIMHGKRWLIAPAYEKRAALYGRRSITSLPFINEEPPCSTPAQE